MKNKTKIFFFKVLIIGIIFILESGCRKKSDPYLLPNTVTDIDGNVYHTATIGTQVWFVENLRTTRYRNGDAISSVADSADWSALNAGACCNYNNKPANSAVYGCLYNWYAVTDSRNIAPIGWHVPSDDEWTILSIYLDGEYKAGGKLKEAGTKHWTSPNAGATNSSGFAGLPGGCRQFNATYHGIEEFGYWWSATAHDNAESWMRELQFDNSLVNRLYNFNTQGYSIRCIRNS